MKLLKLSVLAFSVGLLAACSSGGGGGGDSGTSTTNNGKGSLADTSIKSIDLVPEQYKEQVKDAKQITLLDGTVLEIVDYPVGIVQEKVNDGIVKGINLPYSVVGGWLPNDVKVDENGYVIDPRVTDDDFDVFGVATKREQMPVSGVAQYNGYALGAVTSGKLQLNVDFGNETVEGKLYDRKFDNGQQLPDITLNKGTITAGDPNIEKKDVMAFSGVATYKGVEGVYVGSFMGPNAEEVVGAVGTEDEGVYESFAGQRGEIKK